MSESQPLSVAEADPPAEAEPPQDTPARTGSAAAWVPLALSLLALGLSIGLAVAAWFSWHELQQLAGAQSGTESRLENRLEPLRASLTGMEESLRSERQRLDRQIQKLLEQQQRSGEQISALAELVGRSEQGWGLAEVEYLLRIASQRLQLQRDIKTARQALQAADARLQELADPRFLKVREQIAREQEALQAVTPVDIDGLAAQLGALGERVDELTVAGSQYQPPDRAETGSAARNWTVENWRELPALLWSVVSDLFRIREHDQAVKPMLPPEREYFLRENLRLQLSAARLALLRDDAEQYRASLETGRRWLEQYFSSQDARVGEALARLKQLSGVDVAPELPDVSASLRLLRRQLKQSGDRSVPAPAPATDVPAGETESPSTHGDPVS